MYTIYIVWRCCTKLSIKSTHELYKERLENVVLLWRTIILITFTIYIISKTTILRNHSVPLFQGAVVKWTFSLISWSSACLNGISEEFDKKADELNSADDGESGEKSHGAPDQAQLGLELDLLVPLNLVVGGRVKEYVDKLQRWTGQIFGWEKIVSYKKLQGFQIYSLKKVESAEALNRTFLT